MSWRQRLLKRIGPGLLGGTTFGDWFRLLRENRFRVSPACLPRALSISWQSTANSFWAWRENRRFGEAIEATEIPPPLFVLGHYRNGTTHLHNLLAIDDRFAYPNNYQVFYPHTFLSTESFQSPLLQFFMPPRRPMDNIEWTLRSPQEDEFALQMLTGLSPCMGWSFPARREHYQKYLTFRDATPAELDRWQRAFLGFMRKLTYKYGKPLVLKSPPHTARIAILLQLFPGAKFVHIHRDPYAVFPSWKHTLTVNMELQRLQNPRLAELDEYVFSGYREMYEAFFAERGLIRSGHYCEVAYEELERDPMAVMRSIYSQLALPDFDVVSPALLGYLDSIAGYRKNEFPPLELSLRERIGREWRRCFDEWGYDRQ
jgi:hypothetical protein